MRPRKHKLHIALVLTVSLVVMQFSITATAATIYVDNQLSDDCIGTYSIAQRDNSGSDGDAYDTIQEAANVVVAGDIVLIRGGTYFQTIERLYIRDKVGTSESAKITY